MVSTRIKAHSPAWAHDPSLPSATKVFGAGLLGLLSVSATEVPWTGPSSATELLPVLGWATGRLGSLCFSYPHLTVSADYSKRYGQDLVI